MSTVVNELAPLTFRAPLVNPSPNGLYGAVAWADSIGPTRFLSGVRMIPVNYGGEQSSGVWNSPWCNGESVTVDVDASGGKWKYTYAGQTTAGVATNVTATNLLAAIVALSNVAPGEVSVESLGGGQYRIVHSKPGAIAVSDAGGGDALTGGGVSVDAERKSSERPDIPEPFDPITAWAWDECDPSGLSRIEIEQNAIQTLRLREQMMVERQFAERLLFDAASLPEGIETVPDVRAAIGYLEDAIAETGTLGVLHARPGFASDEWGLVLPAGTALRSPLGHQWAFGGGYSDGLGDTIVATSVLYGWRNEATVQTVLQERYNQYAALAERSVVIAYETVIAAVTIT